LLGPRIGLIPHRRLDKGQFWEHRRLFPLDAQKFGLGLELGVGIVGIITDQRFGKKSQVLNTPGKDPDLVKGRDCWRIRWREIQPKVGL
jgi:hypothetical protein